MLLVLQIRDRSQEKYIYATGEISNPFIILIIVYTKDRGLRVVDESFTNAARFTAVNPKSYFHVG